MDTTPELPEDADAAFEAELAELAMDGLAMDGLAMDEAAVDQAAMDDALALAQAKASEHLGDLQRLQAEYINYRKRVDRDRQLAGEMAAGKVIEALVPVLDDIGGARDHGELAGPFAAIADKLEATLVRLGWSSYGAPGDPFDPAIHEALASAVEPGLAVATVRKVAQPGHLLGDRVIRPARVVVAQPE